jgi:UDP-N-acetylmuramoyl-tripeptide--D-alanyl-D-alanine ligase
LSGIVAYILGIQLFLPFIVGIGHIIVFPIAWFEKRRILTNAQRKIDYYKDLTTIGISGSYGKSSVKLLLSTLLDSKQEHTDDVLTTPGNINTEL